MKIIAVIPARYASSRFPGKPLADIHGKPMIWWVYNQIKKATRLNSIIVATDDKRILATCEDLNITVCMTNINHNTPTSRTHEVSTRYEADLYIMINGDEPMIDPKVIDHIIPKSLQKKPYVASAATTISNATDVIDPTNLKVVLSNDNKLLYISRAPIPYPKGTNEYTYKKFVGIQALNKSALDFYVNKPKSPLEWIEESDLLRFIENGIEVDFINVNYNNLSIDTPKDLEKIKKIIRKEEDHEGI
ncbi:MAG: 3-deoxy-manno-octulosonate cytidylyltransferase [Defluviitaleaceae bacterium]|nr:3-deoxy-manno-octulosonate cytidylyltransferase [Defluviitaleaceae bacterium]